MLIYLQIYLKKYFGLRTSVEYNEFKYKLKLPYSCISYMRGKIINNRKAYNDHTSAQQL